MGTKIAFKSFDDPFLYFMVDGVEYCWNPDYGTLINMDTDKIEPSTPEIMKFVGDYYENREALCEVDDLIDRLSKV